MKSDPYVWKAAAVGIWIGTNRLFSAEFGNDFGTEELTVFTYQSLTPKLKLRKNLEHVRERVRQRNSIWQNYKKPAPRSNL